MTRASLTAGLLLLVTKLLFSIEPPGFNYGFGGGVNFSLIQEANTFSLYEDLSGTEYESEYSPLFTNPGSQFFFHGEFAFNSLILAFKPGVASFNFSRTDEIVFSTETLEENSFFLLRYFQLPLEFKWNMGAGNFKPFLGVEGAFSYLLRQGGAGNHSFIHPRFSAGPVGGGVYSFNNFDLLLTLGFDNVLHIINNKADRYNTSLTSPYAQSDIRQHNLNASVSVLFSIGQSNLHKSLECVYPKTRQR
ncbi:MAG: hypothetical protein JXA77_15005 [Bacteroidales bacterium]|nr:hypothetical protein [Bacteroidales bacterium]MBN2818920.1 hypothetical protein [Bacteroidales bacterium]